MSKLMLEQRTVGSMRDTLGRGLGREREAPFWPMWQPDSFRC